jgi:hypothetical protein
VLPEDSTQFASQKIQFHVSRLDDRVIPSRRPSIQRASRPDDVSYRSDSHLQSIIRPDDENFPFRPSPVSRSFELLQLASIWTFQQPVRTTLSVRQASGFLSKTQLWEDRCNVRMMWILVPTHLSIRQVSHSKFRRPDASQDGPDVRASDMEIVYINQSSGRPFPQSRRAKPLDGNYLQRKYDRPEDRAPPSGCGSETGKNFSEILEKSIAQLFVRTAHDYLLNDA